MKYTTIILAFLLGCILASIKAVLGKDFYPHPKRMVSLVIGIAAGLVLAGMSDFGTGNVATPGVLSLLVGGEMCIRDRPKAFIFETREGLQIKDGQALELDVHEFLRLYKETSQPTAPTAQAEQKQAALLERMVALYKGDLMVGNDYGDLVLVERERLKTIYIETCQKLSSFFVKSGEHSKAEDLLRNALAAEPYNENVCLDLLDLYMSQGKNKMCIRDRYSFYQYRDYQIFHNKYRHQ